MKLIIKKTILLENLVNTSKAISSKNLIPILTGIKFDLKDEGLYLSASDSDISIRTFIPKEEITEIVSTGSVVISGKYIVEIIKKLPDKDIVIEVVDGYNTIIQTDGSEFNLNGIDPNEFPNLDLEETKNPIVLNPVTFKTLINQTFFATSLSETRPLLTGINFKLNGSILEVIATDSYRLARKEIDLKDSYENEFNLVIPGKNLIELSRILEDDKENVYLHIFNNKVLFKYKNLVFLSRLISGTYPVSSNIIPSEFKIDIVCNYSDLHDMIDRASLLTSDKDKNTIKLELKNRELIISSNSPEIGKVEEKVSIDNDDTISISFSSKYMLEAIKSFNSEKIHLLMNNDNSPIIVKSDEEVTLVQLVLPIKTY
ncbi:MAG: DNA polymerase III subunit beta [Bacilli bacterium]|nr:DNA polymerase III subunit beta [Bacilli bacterium]